MRKSIISLTIVCLLAIIFSGATHSENSSTTEVISSSRTVLSGLVFIPSSYDYGEVGITNDKTYSLELKNNGGTSSSGSVIVYGTSFSCVNGCSYDLDPAESQLVSVKFTPCYVGSHSGNVYAGSAQASLSGEGTFTGYTCD